MSDRYSVLNRVQLGKETTPGTVAAATIRIQTFSITPSIKTTMKMNRTEGSKRPDFSIANKEWTEASIDGVATYTELPYLLSSLIAKPISGPAPDGVTGVYNHVFISSDNSPDPLQSWTVEHGVPTDCERFAYGMVSGLAFKSTRDDIGMTGSMFGYAMQDTINDSIALSAGQNAVQTIAVSAATGGTFTLEYNGQYTAGIAYNAAASAVQTALQGLTTIGSGNATVSGSAGSYVVTFASALAGIPVPPIIANGTNLTGSGAAVTVTQTTVGGMVTQQKVPILPGDFSIYLGTSWSDIENPANIVTRQFETDWALNDRTSPFWTQNSNQTSWTGIAEKEPKETLDIVMGVDQAYAFKTAYRQNIAKYVRLAYVSKILIGTTMVPHQLIFDACVKVNAPKEFKDEEGIYALGFTLGLMDDPATGMSYRMTVQNGVASY